MRTPEPLSTAIESEVTFCSVRERETEFGVRMRCGHGHSFAIPDALIEDSAPAYLIDVIDEHWHRSLRARKCYCVDPGRVP